MEGRAMMAFREPSMAHERVSTARHTMFDPPSLTPPPLSLASTPQLEH